jgi:transposase
MDTIIAVLGTLAGGALAALLQAGQATAQHRRDTATRRQDAALSALCDLVAALDAHRAAMWHREDLRLTGAEPAEYAAARARSHDTRAAVSAPLTALAVLAPRLREHAQHAATATYALRAAPDPETLATRRATAITAAEALVENARITA